MTSLIEDDYEADRQAIYLNALGAYEIYLAWLNEAIKTTNAIQLAEARSGKLDDEHMEALREQCATAKKQIILLMELIKEFKAEKIDEFTRYLTEEGKQEGKI